MRKRMKKSNNQTILKTLSVFLAVILLAAAAFGGYLLYRFNCNKSGTSNSYDIVYSAEQVRLSTDSKGVFKVLKINDTHFFNGVCADDKHTLEDIKTILDKTQTDLIIADGDLVEGFNLNPSYDKFKAIDLFATLVEAYDIPWTFAPGNNDFEIDGSNEDIIAFMMQYEHFIYGNSKNVDGTMQFLIDIYNKDKLVHSVAVMDSGARKPKAIGAYQPMSENQALWLNSEVNSKNVKTSVFFHMPTNAFQTAYENGASYARFDMYNTYPYDEIKNNDVFDDVIKENKNITLLSCAHQHSNNMCSFYNGRYYQLSSAGGYSAGRNDFIYPSCTLTTINTRDDNVETMYSFEQIRA